MVGNISADMFVMFQLLKILSQIVIFEPVDEDHITDMTCVILKVGTICWWSYVTVHIKVRQKSARNPLEHHELSLEFSFFSIFQLCNIHTPKYVFHP